ncbi:MAG TPA: hypothetical protein PKG63_07995 [Bacteroidales bacterium]|nr:hypothetical protein [Bacteroidales bacterium]
MEQLATGVTITPGIAELLQTILRKYNTKVTNKQIFLPENLSGIEWMDNIEEFLEPNEDEIITGFTGKTFTIGPGDVSIHWILFLLIPIVPGYFLTC